MQNEENGHPGVRVRLSEIDLFFWVAGLIAHAAVLLIILVRKRFRDFPIFTAFISTNLLRSVVLYLVAELGSKRVYFDAYWILAVVDTALQLAVFFELYAHTFRPLGRWAPETKATFFGIASVLITFAAALTWMAVPYAHLWVQVLVMKGSFFSSACMSELFVIMIMMSVRLGLPWKTHVARIAQGLGIYSILDVLVETAHNVLGLAHGVGTYGALSHLRMTAYLTCALYWCITLWMDDPSREMSSDTMSRLLQLQRALNLKLETIRARK